MINNAISTALHAGLGSWNPEYKHLGVTAIDKNDNIN